MTTDPNIVIDKIQALLSDLTPDQAAAEITKLQSQIDPIEAEMERLQAEHRQLRDRQNKWRSVLALVPKQNGGAKQRLRIRALRTDQDGSGVSGRLAHGNVGELTRQLIEFAGAQGAGVPFTLQAVTKEFRSKGHMSHGETELKRLSMTAARLVERGELERVDRGVYQLPSKGSRPEEG